ncbi:MAG: hypothetical protein RL220_1034 [Bacteroidota bacterium]
MGMRIAKAIHMQVLQSYFKATISTLALVFVFSVASLAQVKGPVETIDGKQYYMHKVEKKQTIYSIARLYEININDLLSANPGSDQGIKEGQTLRVPVQKPVTSPAASGKTHTVQKKETLFAIARLYDVDVNALIAANPGSENGIKKGQTLIIPVAAATPVVEEPEISTLPAPPASTITHTVAKGETLYGIAGKYGVKVEEIKALNGNTSDVKEGQVLYIPQPRQNVTVIGAQTEERYTIALMLPFFAHVHDSVALEAKDQMQRDAAFDIYRGVLAALDSLKNEGFNAELYVYDVPDNKTTIQTVLAKQEMKDVDLIIGPVFRDPLKEVSSFATRYGASVVIPVPQSNKVLLSAPNLCKASPSSITLMEELAGFVAAKHRNDNVVLVNSQNLEDTRNIQVFREKYMEARGDTTVREIIANRSVAGLSAKLISGRTNVIVVPSNDKLLLSSLLNSLGKRDDIILYGTSDWENLDLFGLEERLRYHVRFPSESFVDYADAGNIAFIEAFRSRFKKDPVGYTWTGYDIMNYFGRGMMMFGRGHASHFGEIPREGLRSMDFDLVRTGSENGCENTSVFILEHTPEGLRPVSK